MKSQPAPRRRLPVGAEVQPGGGVHFRVWAPDRAEVEALLEGVDGDSLCVVSLAPEGGGYFAGFAPGAADGTLYRFRLDGGPAFPDPASRFQPRGPHGPSQVVDPGTYHWGDTAWGGVSARGQVLYELHLGTFTRVGTWAAAAEQLPALVDVGVTVLEVMPLADFPGRFGWGYDGVNLFAPTHLYGTPDDARQFVDRAHQLGLGVILDVVYNHLGPNGNYLGQFATRYVTDRYKTEWGEPINFDGPDAGPVRELYLANAAYWIDELHLDGLRLDATQCIYDDGSHGEHILAAVGRVVRAAAGGRGTLVVAENEPQHTRLVRPVERGGYGLDALWNDDFHHSAMAALSGRAEAYYSDTPGRPQELISAAKYGYLYQGQRSTWQRQRRGTPAFDLPPAAFVAFIQNHDQIANSGLGQRAHAVTSPGRYRAMTALLLLLPSTPLLFQGQEWAASTPWLYFADHPAPLAEQVRRGREEFLSQFPNVALPVVRRLLPVPDDPATFERSRLDHAERDRPPHAQALALHRDLLRLRRETAVFRSPRRGGVDGAVLGPEALVLRYFGEHDSRDDRLLVVNLGPDLRLEPAPEPLLAPPEGCRWAAHWSSEDPRYGGAGAAPPEDAEGRWRLTAHAAFLLAPEAEEPDIPEPAP